MRFLEKPRGKGICYLVLALFVGDLVLEYAFLALGGYAIVMDLVN